MDGSTIVTIGGFVDLSAWQCLDALRQYTLENIQACR